MAVKFTVYAPQNLKTTKKVFRIRNAFLKIQRNLFKLRLCQKRDLEV